MQKHRLSVVTRETKSKIEQLAQNTMAHVNQRKKTLFHRGSNQRDPKNATDSASLVDLPKSRTEFISAKKAM